MIRYCKIKHCIIGFDRPKICVPLVGRSAEEIIAQADQIRQSQRSSAIDMVELRGDYLDILPDYEVLDACEGSRDSARKSVVIYDPE